MKLINIFALYFLILKVKGAWWAAAAQPVILTLGAVLGALNLDILDVQPITTWNIFVPNYGAHNSSFKNREKIDYEK